MPPAKRTKGRFMAMERIEWVLNLLPLTDAFWALADERRRRFNQLFGKLLEHRQAYAPYAQLLTLIRNSQILLKKVNQ